MVIKIKAIAALLMLLIVFAQPVNADEGVEFKGLHLKVCTIALDTFTIIQPEVDIANFTVIVREATDTYEVIFVPRSGEDELDLKGGRTKYGREMHFNISKDKFEIVRWSFAR